MSHRDDIWNLHGKKYSAVGDARRSTVFPFIHAWIQAAQPRTLLDYGAGDGLFACDCADLDIATIVAYDPSPQMVALAKKNTSEYSQLRVVNSLLEFPRLWFDVVTFNAVWMCIHDEDSCLETLRNIHDCLSPSGTFIASVTHPCFRDRQYSSYKTNFDQRNYLNNGIEFRVTMHDAYNEFSFGDTHWNMSAMSDQLRMSGFFIDRIVELPDISLENTETVGAPWLVLFAVKRRVALASGWHCWASPNSTHMNTWGDGNGKGEGGIPNSGG